MSGSRIREIPKADRPREKLLERGASVLTDAELLAIFIRTGRRGRSAIGVAEDLIRTHGSLHELSRCSAREIQKSCNGIGPAKAAELASAFEIGKRLARSRDLRVHLNTPESVYQILAPEMQALRQEAIRILLLDTKLRLIRMEEVHVGSVNECIAHPRDILRPALIFSAYALVLVHNHPSGDPSPSAADHALTRRLREATELLQLRFKDHIIIGLPEGERLPYFSFAENGHL